MKRIAIILTMCLLLVGCGNAVQPVSESVTETEETVQGTEDVTAETVEQKDAEVEVYIDGELMVHKVIEFN